MGERIRRKPFTTYEEAIDKFTQIRKVMNNLAEENPKAFLAKFEEMKELAKKEDVIAMDVLAYYYKTGVGRILPENYMRYITWEFVSAARGNELAIEKMQFLIGHACGSIIEHEEFDLIAYKNDIDDYNALYVLGKALCKIIVRDYLEAYPVDLVELDDEYAPYKKEDFINVRKMIDESIPKTVEYLLS